MLNLNHPRYADAWAFVRDAAEAVASGGTGRAIALTGPAGAGTLAVLAHAAAELPHAACGPGRPGSARYVPYDAAARLHAAITGRSGLPLHPAEYLASAAPAFGALIAELDQVLIAGINAGTYPVDDLASWVDAAARAAATGLVGAAHRERIGAIMVDQIGWWDPTSRAVLAHLADAAPEAGLLVVIAEGTDRAEARTWLAATMGHRDSAVHTMPGLDAAEVETLAIEAGLALAPGGAERIAAETGGHPVLAEVHLRRLAAADGADCPVPANLTDAAEAALDALSTAERRLLAVAAACGHTFDSATVAALCDRSAPPAAELDRIAAATGLITTGQTSGGGAGYAWRHETLREAVLTGTAPPVLHERASRSLIAAAAGGPMRLEQWIDICRHETARGPAWSGPAAQSLLQATDVAYMCLGFAETAQLAALAQAAAEASTGTRAARSTLGVAALTYRLLAADRPGHADPVGDDMLAAAAEHAAEASGRARYQACAALARARTLQHTAGLDAQIATLKAAHALARRCTDDPTLPQAAAIAYARRLADRDPGAARQILADTETSWDGRDLTGEELLWYNAGQLYYGVLSLEAGDVDTARQRLASALVQATMTAPAQQPVAAHCCAQLHFAIGDDDEATTALEHALQAEAEHAVTSAWGACNRAMLAEHHARTGTAGALALARRAWEEIQASGHPDLVPVVRGHLAETLYHSAADDTGLLDEAFALAGATIAETDRTGRVRSAITAHALAAAIRTRQGRRGEAIGCAQAALELLEADGDQPAMRTEEILYRAAIAHATGATTAAEADQARALLERARAVIDRTAASLDTGQRARYLALPRNRRILDATIEVGH